jgi:hypothetical protein
MSNQFQSSAALLPGKKPGAHLMVVWVGPRTDLYFICRRLKVNFPTGIQTLNCPARTAATTATTLIQSAQQTQSPSNSNPSVYTKDTIYLQETGI